MKTQFTFALLLIATLSISIKSLAGEISEDEKEGIQFMREEEKLAHDVYQKFYQKWKLPIFNTISNAETRHFNAAGYLLENFEISDPASSELGKFKNKEIAFLYDSLIQKGSESMVEALKAGAFIEEFDIADLQKLMAQNSNPVIAGVCQNLLLGSNNHLRAFTRQLESRGEIYNPVILEETVFQEIVQGSHQMGSGNGCVLQPNNCPNQQNVMRAKNRNRGKGRMRGQGFCKK